MEKKEKKLVFILPYFGTFPSYFSLFLKSCEYNPEVDWLIYTDNRTGYSYPKNVIVRYITLEEIRERIEKSIGFSISLHRAYKLCDFRPIYGDIFQDDIKEYQYWGHCDCDLIFGDIKKFVFPLLEQKYHKLFFLGHCTLYQNNIENNTLYRKTKRYKTVFTTSNSLHFDEEFQDSINTIFLANKRRIYLEHLEANIDAMKSYFYTVKYDFKKSKYVAQKETESLFLFDHGKIIKYNQNFSKEIISKEYLYIHLRERNMKMEIDTEEYYKIIPNMFQSLEVSSITKENFKSIHKGNFNMQYFLIRWKRLKQKLGRMVGFHR